jgi:hypothetical protein
MALAFANERSSDTPAITSNPDPQAATELHIQRALDSMQEAYELVGQAIQALSRVERMIPRRTGLVSVSDQLTQTWFAVRATANRLRRKGQPRVNCR